MCEAIGGGGKLHVDRRAKSSTRRRPADLIVRHLLLPGTFRMLLSTDRRLDETALAERESSASATAICPPGRRCIMRSFAGPLSGRRRTDAARRLADRGRSQPDILRTERRYGSRRRITDHRDHTATGRADLRFRPVTGSARHSARAFARPTIRCSSLPVRRISLRKFASND